MEKLIKQIDNFIEIKGLRGTENHPLNLKVSKLINADPYKVFRILFCISVTICLILVRLLFDKIVLAIVGVLYPMHETLKAVNDPQNHIKDLRLWLVYWACYGVYSFAHELLQFVFRDFPFFYLMECVFLVWLYHPNTKGAELINSYFLNPFLKNNGPIQDKIVFIKNKFAGNNENKEELKPNRLQ